MKSALRDLRHLAAIPALMNPDRGDEDESEKGRRIAVEREARMKTAWREEFRHLDPALRPYLLGRQHDARIVGFRREGARFTVTAHDEDLAALAAHAYAIGWSEARIPLGVVFEGVTYVGWRRVESDDALVPAPAPILAPASTRKVDWLDDAFVERDEPGVRWALQFWVSARHPEARAARQDGTHLLLVEAGSVRIAGGAREAWRARFGEDALALFDRYAAVRTDLPLANSSRADERVRALVESRDAPIS